LFTAGACDACCPFRTPPSLGEHASGRYAEAAPAPFGFRPTTVQSTRIRPSWPCVRAPVAVLARSRTHACTARSDRRSLVSGVSSGASGVWAACLGRTTKTGARSRCLQDARAAGPDPWMRPGPDPSCWEIGRPCSDSRSALAPDPPAEPLLSRRCRVSKLDVIIADIHGVSPSAESLQSSAGGRVRWRFPPAQPRDTKCRTRGGRHTLETCGPTGHDGDASRSHNAHQPTESPAVRVRAQRGTP
jgi:hypothetical protein